MKKQFPAACFIPASYFKVIHGIETQTHDPLGMAAGTEGRPADGIRRKLSFYRGYGTADLCGTCGPGESAGPDYCG